MYVIHTLLTSPMISSTFLNIAIIGGCALVGAFFALFAISVSVELSPSEIVYQNLLGCSSLRFNRINTMSRFSGKGAGFLKIRSDIRNITLSTYTFSASDLATIEDIVAVRRVAALPEELMNSGDEG